MGYFRALKPLQASLIGLRRAGEEFAWEGSIVGWHVEPLDDDAVRMVEERAKALKARGEKGPGAEGERPLPTQVFPAGVMKASAGMTAAHLATNTPIDTTPAANASAPQMGAAPRRRKAS